MYHCSIKIISRSGGRSAVASSAYRSGEKLKDEETGIEHDYTKKGGVVYSEMMLPEHAPKEYQNRELLWNEVEKIEKQSNAQLAREIEVALPKELIRGQQIEVVRNYVKENFVDKGMCADWSLHDKEDGNPHAHIMLTTRAIKENGQWAQKEKKDFARDENGNKIPVIDPITGLQKVRVRKGKGEEKQWQRVTVKANDWNDQKRAEEWRKGWADECNKYLSHDHQLDHRSYERQGKEQIPTIHEGYVARQMESKQAGSSEKVQINQEIKQTNQELQSIHQQEMSIETERRSILQILQQLKEKAKEALNERLQRLRTTRATNEPVGRNADGNRPVQADNQQFRDRSIEERLASLQSHRESRADESTVGELLRSARADLDSADAIEKDSSASRDDKISERQDREAIRERQRAEAQRRAEEAKRVAEERKAERRANRNDFHLGR